jgi:hypothetical protein
MAAASITAEKAARRSVETEKLNNGFMSPEASITDTADQLVDELSRV